MVIIYIRGKGGAVVVKCGFSISKQIKMKLWSVNFEMFLAHLISISMVSTAKTKSLCVFPYKCRP